MRIFNKKQQETYHKWKYAAGLKCMHIQKSSVYHTQLWSQVWTNLHNSVEKKKVGTQDLNEIQGSLHSVENKWEFHT